MADIPATLARAVLLSSGVALPVVSGQITVDRTANVRRTGRAVIAGLRGWTPTQAGDALDPRSGVEVRIDVGHPSSGWTPAGVYSLSRAEVTQSATGWGISVDLADRSHRAKLAGMDRRWVVSTGTRITSAVAAILGAVYPGLPVSLPATITAAVVTDVVLEYGDDAWQACQTLLATTGWDLHVDRTGVATVAPVAPAAGAVTPVKWVTWSRGLASADIINAVGAEWSLPRPEDATGWVPAGGLVEAVDDVSPTGITSPVGKRCKKWRGDSSILASAAAAYEAARSQLLDHMDATYSGSGTIVPDPAHDVGMTVTSPEGGTYRVGRLTIDLAGAATGVDLGMPEPTLAQMLARQAVPLVERRTREVVESITPVRTRLLTDRYAALVRCDTLGQTLAVGDVVDVLHAGMGRRTVIGKVA